MSQARAEYRDGNDEAPHDPGADPGWVESWGFDFAAPDASVGGFVRITLRPYDGVCWYWAYLVGPGRDPVMLVDDEVALPRHGSLEIRAEGLWADHIVEQPFDHVSVGLEAFALRLDDPAEALGRLWGERVGFGLDLGWETDGDVVPLADDALADVAQGAQGYEVPCQVVGEVLLGDERFDVDAAGWRDHLWGAVDPWADPWWSVRGRFTDGGWFSGGSPLAAEPVAFAPLVVPANAPRAGISQRRLLNALCRFHEVESRRAGVGWLRWNIAIARSDRTKAVPGR